MIKFTQGKFMNLLCSGIRPGSNLGIVEICPWIGFTLLNLPYTREFALYACKGLQYTVNIMMCD
jgi:hypothetical protein